MNYFIDTNIAIGYTIVHDKYHEKSCNFIDNTFDNIYWSDVVKNEYDSLSNKINYDTIDFLNLIEDFLITNEKLFINYYQFEKKLINRTKEFDLDKYKKIKILELFWNINKFSSQYSSEIFIFIQDFIEFYNKIFFKRDEYLKNKLILHHCGLDKYKLYYKFLKVLFDNGIHKPDCKIIGDVYDLSDSIKPLSFVSLDDDFINNLNDLNLTFIEFNVSNLS